MSSNIVALRNKMNRKRPVFRHQSMHKIKSVRPRYRKARGSDSKVMIKRKGYPVKVEIGYRGPAAARGLSMSGHVIATVYTLAEVSALDPKTHAACIGAVGTKRKIELLKACIERKVNTVNVRDPQKFIADTNAQRSKDKEEKKKRAELKEKSKQAAAKKAEKKEDKKSADAPKSEEDKKTEEKKEQDKILTQKSL